MKKAFESGMGAAEPLTDAQKSWLEKNNGETIWTTMWGKYKKKEMSLATIVQAFTYHLESKGLEKLPGLCWVKTKDIPKMGITENADGSWAVVVTEENIKDEVRVGRRTVFEERKITTCKYVEYLKKEDERKKYLSINKDKLMAEAIELFGVEDYE